MKRKVLISVFVSAAAAVSGIAPSIVTSTNVQSSLVNGNEDQQNPSTNPDINNPNVNNPDDENPSSKFVAYAPENDIFTYEINFTDLQNDENLDKVLKSLFADGNLLNKESKYLLNANEYENVEISYVENSAKFNEKTFEFLATPINDAEWDIPVKGERIVKVQIGNLHSLATDSQFPSKALMTNNIGDWSISDDKDLENLIVDNMNKINYKAATDVANVSSSNVSIEYIYNSADLKNKQFKVKVSPIVGHAWSDGSGIASREVVVQIQKLTWYGNFSLAPIYWTVNSTILSDFKVKSNTSWDQTHFWKIFGLDSSKNEWVKEQIYNSAMKDFQKLFPVTPYYNTYKFAKWDTAIVYKQGIRFFFRSYVQPKSGLTWYDGSTALKEVQFNFYVSSKNLAGNYPLGTTTDLSQLSTLVDQNYDENGLPNQWVTSFGQVSSGQLPTEENKKYFAERVQYELSECYQPLYNFTITDVQTMSGNNTGQENWTFTVNFLNKHTGEIIKSIPGYSFRF
ncbi:MAG: hypothetical protein K2J69_00975 [Malacoplasma sp.]|nr:hypothetical protein [Malacoplasma sp.]MDE6894033.1 hypothetical protein [Malacoplasma sp.]MDE7075561.1 hypothetical protein [Malacoplasma sp.]